MQQKRNFKPGRSASLTHTAPVDTYNNNKIRETSFSIASESKI